MMSPLPDLIAAAIAVAPLVAVPALTMGGAVWNSTGFNRPEPDGPKTRAPTIGGTT